MSVEEIESAIHRILGRWGRMSLDSLFDSLGHDCFAQESILGLWLQFKEGLGRMIDREVVDLRDADGLPLNHQQIDEVKEFSAVTIGEHGGPVWKEEQDDMRNYTIGLAVEVDT